MIDGLKPYDNCNDSGLPWLGAIPSHWKVWRAKYVFREIDARSLTGEETQLSMSQVHGLVESSKIDTWRMRSESYVGGKLCAPNDLVLNRLKAHLGVFSTAKLAGVISPDYSVFRPIADANARYFEQLLKTPQCVDEIRRHTKGIVEGFWRLYTDDFYNLSLPIPPADEQADIVRFLDHADRRIRRYIRAKRQLIALLNEQKQAIIHRAVTRGLDPHVKLKPSGVEWLGDVPAHWDVMRCRYIFREVDKRSLNGSEQHLSMSQKLGLVPSHLVDNRTLVSESYAGGKLCEANDLVLNRLKAHLGVFSLASDAGVISPDYTVLRAFDPRGVQYFEHVLRSPACRFELRVRAKGIVEGFWRLYTDDFYDIRLPVPPPEERLRIIACIADAAGECDHTMGVAERECELVREYRTRLIADVVTGKLDIRKAAAALPDELDAVESDDGALLDQDETTDDVELDTEPEEVEV